MAAMGTYDTVVSNKEIINWHNNTPNTLKHKKLHVYEGCCHQLHKEPKAKDDLAVKVLAFA